MKELITQATRALFEHIGQDKIMVLATRNGDGVAARTVDVYYYDDCFYFVTETDSHKYAQITGNKNVALGVDAVQITGSATFLDHPCSESNKQVKDFVESQLPQQFARYADNPVVRLIKITPVHASFISMETGTGYVIDFTEQAAVPIEHKM